MPPTTETPQVAGGVDPISPLTKSTEVDRAVQPAPVPPRRIRRHRPTATVSAVAIYTTSRRDLPRSIFIARCPECERRRQFNASGRRLCPCGTFLHLIPGAEVG